MAKHTKKHPIKKKTHDTPAVMKVRNQNNTWKYATIILGAMLLVSIFTGGFSLGTSVDTVKADINQLLDQETSATTKTALNNALQELDKVTATTTPTGDSDGGETMGGEGKVIIEEFSDFECPFCGRAVPTIDQIKSTYGDDVEIVYRHFPLSFHPNAQKAGEAAECARDQGEFWAMHDKLFENQQSLSASNYKAWAAELGLDSEEFNNCLDSGEKAQVVQDDFNEGRAKGVTGTPTFFINGQKLVGAQPFSAFEPVIEAALSGAAPAVADPTPAPTPTPTPTPSEVEVTLDADDYVKGDADAPVTIIEWADFACGFCGRHYEQTLPQLQQEYIDAGTVNYVYKFAPVVGGDAAAEAAACAGDQDLFWEMHDMLFDESAGRSTKAQLKTLAANVDGLDQAAFDSCLDSGEKAAQIQADFDQAREKGFSGTPFFIVGAAQEDGTIVGQPVRGAQPFTAFQSAIEAAQG